MSDRVAQSVVVVVLLGTLLSAGCTGRPGRIYPPDVSASAGSAAMKQYDTDGDGKVAGEELDKAPSLKSAIENLDTNGDGAVSGSEVTERIAAWKESKLGRMSLSVTVQKGGEPLEGTKVVFEPEKFLGPDYVAATGVTDEFGIATLSIPVTDRDDPEGVPPGLYLVRITHPTEEIPAKYNTETTLGEEASLDAIALQIGVTYDVD
jgi:hypothetical protein